MMKLCNLLSFLPLLYLGSAAKCGTWYTSDCFCDTDVRYCDEGQNGASDDILDQHPLWKHMQGFYKFEAYNFAFGLYLGSNFAQTNPYIGYLNHTIVGSRDYQHRYDILPPANASDPTKCGYIYDPFVASLPDYVCGENGILYLFEGFAVSTNERDGSLTTTPNLVTLGSEGVTDSYVISEEDNAKYKMVPVDENTLQGSVDSEVFLVTETFIFTNPERTEASSMQDVYAKTGENQSVLVQSTRFKFTKIDEQSFKDGLIADLEANNIVPSLRPDAVPMERTCLNPQCPSEENFCQIDPKCTISKYQEPEATIKAGPIVGIVCAVFAVLLVALYLIHRSAMARQKERLKDVFAKHVVQSLGIGKGASADFFTMEGLQREFNQIDVGEEGGDGKISKKELHAFMTSGKMGDVSDSDFNTLFGIIDSDGNGEVDFIEFASFMGDIKSNIEEYDNDGFDEHDA